MIAIVGIGETPPARKTSQDVRSLVLQATLASIADAGLKAGAIDGLITDSGIMPTTVPPQWLAAQLGIELRYSASLSYGGAASVAAPLLAADAIRSGRARAVLYYFGVDWGSRPGGPYAFHDIYPAKSIFEKPYGFNAQPIYFGMWARRYMHEYGLTTDDLADIAIAQRKNAILNGHAQQQKSLDRQSYYNSRLIADPLRVPDCCLVSDGAAAYIMTSVEAARDCRHIPVSVLGAGFASSSMTGDDVFTQPNPLLTTPAAGIAAAAALQAADISLAQINFAQIYDCSTISYLLQIEDVGFCRKGEGPDFLRERDTTISGDLPINTHGGLLSYSYRLGVEHVIETVRQLRHSSGPSQVPHAAIGLVGGFSPPDYGVSILGRG